MDVIFKAVADPCRRAVLDLLAERDGRTSGQIEKAINGLGFSLSRFGVMKHLKVLEDARLVIPRRAGRFKHHYLNVVPLQQVMDRWIEPLIKRPMAHAMLELKYHLEGEAK